MVDKEILEALSELSDADLRRLQLLLDNKLNESVDTKKVSYRKKHIKCGNILIFLILLNFILLNLAISSFLISSKDFLGISYLCV